LNFLNPKITPLLFISLIHFCAVPVCWPQEKVTIYAAASATNAIMDIAKAFEDKRGVKVLASFASSAALAKQIEAGAPAQVYLSANPEWMDYLEEKKLIEAGSRRDLLGNALVVVAPRGRTFPLKAEKGVDFAAAFQGKLAMGDPSHVPAGMYAKEALIHLGWWESAYPRMVGTMDVRSALNFVEMGEAAAGIVYSTDARMSEKVEVVAVLPEESHSPISYPVALVREAGGTAREFLNFLVSPTAKTIFTKYGFTVK
jgi:molybdate transport system substrate-binding protein